MVSAGDSKEQEMPELDGILVIGQKIEVSVELMILTKYSGSARVLHRFGERALLKNPTLLTD
ncbi:MAG: hypothetical protein R3C49_26495 [Planctomycetaceae bacterium]